MNNEATVVVGLFVGIIVFSILASAIRVLREYERGVIFRLGRCIGTKGPGIFLLIPVVDKMVKVDLRVITMDVPSQEVMTRDNVPVRVNAVVYFKVLEAVRAVCEVSQFVIATSLIAQTTLRSVLGSAELDDLLSEREKINRHLQEVIDHATSPWGIKITLVEVRELELPEGMKRAMAKQAEAERERRAKVVHALGEFQAAEQLAKAADILGKHPAGLQLRYLQTLVEVASERNSTTIFPIPIDLFRPFLERAALASTPAAASPPSGSQ